MERTVEEEHDGDPLRVDMEILYYPDARLRLSNAPLSAWSVETERKVEEMRLLLSRVHGAGLAAPQVGWNVQLFILSIPEEGGKKERTIFDPVMTPIGATRLMDEGCLSFPEIFGAISRYDSVRLIAKTPEGPIDEVLSGFEAHAVQHEMDHLNGILFIEKMTPADRQRNAAAIRQLEEDWKRRQG